VSLTRCSALIGGLLAISQPSVAKADDIACVSTTFRFIGANDKVCVSAFDDPKVPGVACHISHFGFDAETPWDRAPDQLRQADAPEHVGGP
jgi:catabolite regulation protein CreA